MSVNKYAIYAYTHSPVTGSGPSGPAFRRLYKPWVLLASIGHGAKGPSSSLPPPSSLLPYSANVKLTARLSALAVRKTVKLWWIDYKEERDRSLGVWLQRLVVWEKTRDKRKGTRCCHCQIEVIPFEILVLLRVLLDFFFFFWGSEIGVPKSP